MVNDVHALEGHTKVLTEMRFSDTVLSWSQHHELTFRDPYVGTPNLRRVPSEQMPDSMFVMDLTLRRI